MLGIQTIHSKLLPTKSNDTSLFSSWNTIPLLEYGCTERPSSKEHPEFRPAESAPFGSAWVYNPERLYDVLKWFSSEITEESICVFYCKKGNPIDDERFTNDCGNGDIVKIVVFKTTRNNCRLYISLMGDNVLSFHSPRPEKRISRLHSPL